MTKNINNDNTISGLRRLPDVKGVVTMMYDLYLRLFPGEILSETFARCKGCCDVIESMLAPSGTRTAPSETFARCKGCCDALNLISTLQ